MIKSLKESWISSLLVFLGLSESHLGWKCCLLECVVYFLCSVSSLFLFK